MDINKAIPTILVSRVNTEMAQGLLGLKCRALSFHAGVLSWCVLMSPEVLTANVTESFPPGPSRAWDCSQFSWPLEMRFRAAEADGGGS